MAKARFLTGCQAKSPVCLVLLVDLSNWIKKINYAMPFNEEKQTSCFYPKFRNKFNSNCSFLCLRPVTPFCFKLCLVHCIISISYEWSHLFGGDGGGGRWGDFRQSRQYKATHAITQCDTLLLFLHYYLIVVSAPV